MRPREASCLKKLLQERAPLCEQSKRGIKHLPCVPVQVEHMHKAGYPVCKHLAGNRVSIEAALETGCSAHIRDWQDTPSSGP